MSLRPGTRLRSTASSCEVVVVKAPATDDGLLCAGFPMTDGPAPGTPVPPSAGVSQIALGKRYSDEATGIEVLCVKPGPGPLTIGGAELALKSAKPLPASD